MEAKLQSISKSSSSSSARGSATQLLENEQSRREFTSAFVPELDSNYQLVTTLIDLGLTGYWMCARKYSGEAERKLGEEGASGGQRERSKSIV